jgi:hypothetical protein
MVYGRLDVYWPDSEFNTFLLEDDSISVGRSSGCSITLDTDTISRYHFNILHEDGEVQIKDLESANGTYVDGLRLGEGATHQLHGGEEIQIGSLRIIYYAEADQPTVPMNHMDAGDTQRFEREDFGFRVDVTPPEGGIPPGSHKSYDIEVTNISESSCIYTVSITGLPHGWGRVNRPTLRVEPDETVTVTLNVKPPRRSDTQPDDYPITIIVAYEDDPDKKIEAYSVVTIEPYNAFAMALVTRNLTIYDRLQVALFNQGSAPLPVHVSAVSADDALNITLDKPQRLLQPGERVEVRGEVKPKRRKVIGSPESYNFDIQVRSQDEAGFLTAMRGHFVDEPILPRWSVYALGALALAAVALMMVALVLVLSATTAQPEITSFTVDAQQVTSGEPLNLNWEAQNVERFDIRVNGVAVRTGLSSDSTSVILETDVYPDQTMMIELVAINGEETTMSEISVDVLPSITIDTFSVTPATIYRYVITEMNVRWAVDGAQQTRIDGLQSVRRAADVSVEVEPTYGISAEFTIEGYVADEFSVTLIAEGRRGDPVMQTVTVSVIDPTCVPNSTTLALFEQPSIESNVVTQTGSLDPVVVDRIDQTRQWLRIPRPGGVFVWGPRSEFVCDEAFSPDALLTEVVVLPATPTLPPTQTPVPQATQTPIPAATQTPANTPIPLPSATEAGGE